MAEQNQSDKSLLLEVDTVTKTFPGVTALDEVNFELRPGEIHVLIGENGAGKSTLMKIISGVYPPDSGTVLVKNEPVVEFQPNASRRRGIATVFQELSLVGYLTVEENMLLGREPTGVARLLDFGQRREIAKRYLNMVEVQVSLTDEVRSLGVAEQQMVEIAKALSLDPDILIMDEPTSKLFGKETEVLFGLVKQLRDQGKGIIWITHRLDEVPQLADRVTVLRDGAYIDTLGVEEATADRLIKLMVGRELTQLYYRTPHQPGEELLHVENLSLDGELTDISFGIRQGEVVGLAGLVGAGRSMLAKILAGIAQPTQGQIFLESSPVRIDNPIHARDLGIAFIPEDRRAHSLVMLMSVRDNVVLASLRDMILDFGSLNRVAEKYVDQLEIRTPSIATPVSQLSGGNQQKVAIAKWLSSQARLFVLDEPTQGIDVGAKVQLYELFDELARQGAALLLISSDMKEVLGICDRILVMREGRLAAEFGRDEATQEAILRAAITD